MEKTPSEAARDLLRVDDWDATYQVVETALGQLGDQGHSAEIWSLRIIRTDIMRLRGEVEVALNYLTLCEALYAPVSDDIASHVRLKMTCGYCLGHLGKYVPSHELMHQAEVLAAGAGLLELCCEVRQRQAMILYLQEDYKASEQIFRAILADSAKAGGWYFRANAQWGIGKNLMIQGQYRDAIPWLEESLTAFQEAGARLSVATVWQELSVCYLGLGDDRASLELLNQSLQIFKDAGHVHNYLVALANIGNVYLHRGDQLRAIDFYRKALSLAQEIKDPVSIRKWSKNLRIAYRHLQDAVNQLDSRVT